MDRVSNGTARAARPTAGAPTAEDYFAEAGDAGGPTTFGSDWANDVQETLLAVLAEAGITPTKGLAGDSQLYDAIQGITFRTGDLKLSVNLDNPHPGWIEADDGTIGSASSGATTLAHASAEGLYRYLWDTVADAFAPVTGGRGASAGEDWAADKPLRLPLIAGRAVAVAGDGAGLPLRFLGQEFGSAESHDHGGVTGTENQTPGPIRDDDELANNFVPENHTHTVSSEADDLVQASTCFAVFVKL